MSECNPNQQNRIQSHNSHSLSKVCLKVFYTIIYSFVIFALIFYIFHLQKLNHEYLVQVRLCQKEKIHKNSRVQVPRIWGSKEAQWERERYSIGRTIEQLNKKIDNLEQYIHEFQRKSQKRTPRYTQTFKYTLSEKEKSIVTDEASYLASQLNNFEKKKQQFKDIESTPSSFTINLQEFDIQFRLTEYFQPILTIIITTPKAEIYTATLSDQKLLQSIASDFGSAAWLYEYLYDRRNSDVLEIDSNFSLIIEKDYSFASKKYKVPTVKQVITRELMASSIIKKITQLNSVHEKRIQNIEENLHIFTENYKRNISFVDYTFSKIHKDTPITVSQNGKICEKTGNEFHSFIILEKSLGLRYHKLSVLILQKAYWISFGIGTLPSIQISKYSHIWKTRQTFQLASNNKIGKRQQQIGHSLDLNTNDVLLIEVIDKKIIYRKKGSQTNAVVIDIDIEDDKWKDMCLFANLYRAGDSLAILT